MEKSFTKTMSRGIFVNFSLLQMVSDKFCISPPNQLFTEILAQLALTAPNDVTGDLTSGTPGGGAVGVAGAGRGASCPHNFGPSGCRESILDIR